MWARAISFTLETPPERLTIMSTPLLGYLLVSWLVFGAVKAIALHAKMLLALLYHQACALKGLLIIFSLYRLVFSRLFGEVLVYVSRGANYYLVAGFISPAGEVVVIKDFS